MDPLTLTALTAGVSSIKGLMENASNLRDIYGAVDKLLHHAEQKPKPKKRKMLKAWSGDDDTAEATETVLNRLEADRQLDLLKKLVNSKWPTKPDQPDAWTLIEQERERQKERRAKAAKKKAERDLEKREFLNRCLMWTGQILLVLALIGGLIAFLVWAAQKGGSG